MGTFHGSGPSTSNSKPDASGKLQTKGKICYRCGKGRHQPDWKCDPIDAICKKCGKKGHYAVNSQNGKGFPCSYKSAHVVETSSGASTSQIETDFYNEAGQPIYVQSHILQTMSAKSEKIPEKSQLLLKFPIGLHYKHLNQKVLLKVDTGLNINCISLGTFQKLFPNEQLNRSTLLLQNDETSPVSIIGSLHHSSDGKERCSIKKSCHKC